MQLTTKEIIFSESKRIVIKLGSRILTEEEPGVPARKGLSRKRIAQIAKLVANLKNRGKEVIIISSGAVGTGMGILGLKKRPKRLSTKQACAALGQVKLMKIYGDFFAMEDFDIAQLLVSADDFRDRERYTNIKNTANALLKKDIIPIVNENDSIATEEIRVGDNDKLSSDISHLVSADLLVIFSDEDGLYDKNPKTNTDAKLFDVIEEVTEGILNMADGDEGSEVSTGGMKTKLQAVYEASQTKCNVILANGFTSIRNSIFSDPTKGTLFLSQNNALSSRQKWLGYISTTHFTVVVDKGAAKALTDNAASLLVMGVLSFEGEFTQGDLVDICNTEGETIARGAASYHWKDLEYILNEPKDRLDEIREELELPLEIIHRSDMVLLNNP